MVAGAIKWVGGVDGFLEFIDQRRLPKKLVKIKCRSIDQLSEAIKTLAVRGAPAIGVCAAYGLTLAMQELAANDDLQTALACLQKSSRYLASSRPTAANLFWAMDRVSQNAQRFISANPTAKLQILRNIVLDEANTIYNEDVDMCRRIGQIGQKFIKNGDALLTHCNAGALATAGQGTALSIMFEAHKKNRKFKVYVDETRPLLQGARLTAWELKHAGIDVVVICDSTAGWLMKQGRINAVITGADRIAANGDTANKIGTYTLSILAANHNIPFYIAAPSSTFDLNIKNGTEIPIEQRPPDEVTTFAETQIAPASVIAYNPAFDVTDAENITAIITEKGVIEKPNAAKIAAALRKNV
jgi:methylthioribose-1-phosphate isomerase